MITYETKSNGLIKEKISVRWDEINTLSEYAFMKATNLTQKNNYFIVPIGLYITNNTDNKLNQTYIANGVGMPMTYYNGIIPFNLTQGYSAYNPAYRDTYNSIDIPTPQSLNYYVLTWDAPLIPLTSGSVEAIFYYFADKL